MPFATGLPPFCIGARVADLGANLILKSGPPLAVVRSRPFPSARLRRTTVCMKNPRRPGTERLWRWHDVEGWVLDVAATIGSSSRPAVTAGDSRPAVTAGEYFSRQKTLAATTELRRCHTPPDDSESDGWGHRWKRPRRHTWFVPLLLLMLCLWRFCCCCCCCCC